MINEIQPRTETISKETNTRTEYQFYDANSSPVHQTRVIYKTKPLIRVYPFSYNAVRGITKNKIAEIEFRGWSNYDSLPKLLKPRDRININNKKVAPVIRALRARYPDVKKIIIIRENGKNRFSAETVTLNYPDLVNLCRIINKEISIFEERRKVAAQNGLAGLSISFSVRPSKLAKGALSYFLSHYNDEINLSTQDTDAVLDLIPHLPIGNIAVTENFLQTKNRVNIAYLEDVIGRFETLLSSRSDNEKDWQRFFVEHGWILASIFPYQVVLNKDEAYVGGKTFANKEGRIVDFLFQNGFRDNYALMEIKTHNKKIMKPQAYREPEAFAQHEDCSGAVSQCLDQKNIFLTDMGQRYTSLDPKVVLVIGMKSALSEGQVKAFELMRSNQKNVDIVTFDEVLAKINGLRSILRR